MKSLIAALLLVSGSAMAFSNNNSTVSAAVDDTLYTKVLSYCDNNNVVTENQDGQIVIQMNCSSFGKTCQALEPRLRGKTVIYSAYCQ